MSADVPPVRDESLADQVTFGQDGDPALAWLLLETTQSIGYFTRFAIAAVLARRIRSNSCTAT
jgi:hypothetical protein